MKPIRRWALRLAALIFLGLFGFWCLASLHLYRAQDGMIFPHQGPAFGQCAELQALGGQQLSREWQGQAVRYVLFKGAAPKATLLFFHGNAGTVCERATHARGLRSPDWDLVLLEFPGYGGDPLPPSQPRLLANALAAYDLFKRDQPRRPILLFGKSLGAAPATYLASQRPVAGFVSQTPFPSINAVARGRYPYLPVSWLNRSPFPAHQWAAQVACPVLVLHGTADEVTPYALGAEQAKNFPRLQGLETYEGARHSDMHEREPGRYWGSIRSFLRACAGLKRNGEI